MTFRLTCDYCDMDFDYYWGVPHLRIKYYGEPPEYRNIAQFCSEKCKDNYVKELFGSKKVVSIEVIKEGGADER